MASGQLLRLARLYGVLASYRDGFRRDRQTSTATLLAVLRSLGARVHSPDDAPQAVRRALSDRWSRLVEPVCVVWQGGPQRCVVRLPESAASAGLRFSLEAEAGEVREWSVATESLCARRAAEVCGTSYLCVRVAIPGPLPLGYHRLRVSAAGRSGEALLIHAPRRCPDLPRSWGVFVPLYAVHSTRSGGVGTFSDLGRLARWVRALGGGLVGTLPLLATFLDDPFAPSPYTPVSRLFWNELFVDLASVPEWTPALGGIVNDSGRHVDYRRHMGARRAALQAALSRIPDVRRAQLAQFAARKPELRRYAAFRAGLERGSDCVREFDLADPGCAYHAYAQWIAGAQLAAAARGESGGGPGLYLDLPLGVHPDGYDRMRYSGVFASAMSGGAPPDRFFSKGQNWGFAPLHPAKARETGHGYFRACLRHHMRHAAILRIDHVMGLHRMYWIPEGMEGDQGAYVRSPADELYAIVCLEAARSGVAVVGEDLGTVPEYVRHRMAERGVRRMYVSQFSVRTSTRPGLRAPPRHCVASVNTHDTAMFAAFWGGRDIEEQVALGLLGPEHAVEARASRERVRECLLRHLRRAGAIDDEAVPSPAALLAACLGFLAASAAECVMVTLEDLLGEVEPQNTPGTHHERPNWTRRARQSLEGIFSDPLVRAALERVNRGRRS